MKSYESIGFFNRRHRLCNLVLLIVSKIRIFVRYYSEAPIWLREERKEE